MEHLAQDLERALDAEPPAPLSRARVPRELLRGPDLDDLLGLALRDWAVIGACWLAMAALPVWAWPLPMLGVASRLHAFGVILHDVAHQPLRGKPWRVRALEALCGWPLATTLNAMRYHHLRHHRDNGMPSDPYFKAGVEESRALYALQTLRGLLLLPFWTVRTGVGLVAWRWPAARNAYGRIFLQDRSGEDLTDSAEVIACGRAEAGQLAFQLGVLALLSWAPVPVIAGYLLPGTLAGVLAARRLLVEHRYERAPDRRVETILATTRDHGLSPWVAWLLAPHHIGYHVVHHVHPQVGLRHLPALRDWYLANTPGYPEPR